MKITIRNYSQKDIPEILSIINFNILNTTSIYDYNERTIEQQTKIFNDKLLKKFPIIVAEIDNECVGFGSYSEFRFREANIFTVEHSIYVSNDLQGLGIGNLLMKKLILIAQGQNIHTMIGVIDTNNKSSIQFHEKFGFKNVGIIKETAFKFNKWLDTAFLQLILE